MYSRKRLYGLLNPTMLFTDEAVKIRREGTRPSAPSLLVIELDLESRSSDSYTNIPPQPISWSLFLESGVYL